MPEKRRILTGGRSMRMTCVADFRHTKPVVNPFALDDYVDRDIEQIANVVAVEGPVHPPTPYPEASTVRGLPLMGE